MNLKSAVWFVSAVLVVGCGGGPGGNVDGGHNGDGGTGDGAVMQDGSTPGAVCGDQMLDASEACDGDLVRGATCEAMGFAGGTMRCFPDCRALNLTECTVASVMETVTPAAPLAIMDNAYDGTIASMTCVDVVVAAGTRGFVNNEAFGVQLAMDHSFVGDLVVKLVAPSGHVSTLMHRPGLVSPADNGDLSGGNNANWTSTHPITLARGIGGFMSEALGNNLTTAQAPCRDSADCRFIGVAPVGPDEIEREPVAGTWRVCVGDAGPGDMGTITSVRLDLATTVQPEPLVDGGEVLFTDIADGAFDGTIASMTCRTFNLTGADASLETMSLNAQFAITHPNVGDLVFAVVGPDGAPRALAVRPGVAEAADGSGTSLGAEADLAASPRVSLHLGGTVMYPSAESMGEGIAAGEVVCGPSSSCNFNADSGALTWDPASELLNVMASGTYQLCVGDARTGSVGTFSYGVLGIELQP